MPLGREAEATASVRGLLPPPILAIVIFSFRLLVFLHICIFHLPSQRLVDANMEVASSDDVVLVEVLNKFSRSLGVQISFFLRGEEMPPLNICRVSRGDIYRLVKENVVLLEDPFLPGLVWG